MWALSCIGAWVGIVYNQFDNEVENKDRAELTYQFFKNGVFRDDESYERFPINSVFGTDWSSNTKALMKYVSDIENYKAVWQPHTMMNAFAETVSMFSDPKKKLDEGDINGWILNQVMAPNPFVRNMMSMMYLSEVNGLSRINYPKSEFMKRINFERLKKAEKPTIFHNAWNLDKPEARIVFQSSNDNHERKVHVRRRYQRQHFVRVFGASLHRRNGRDQRSYILRRRARRYSQLR